jgi:DUF2933 family protein
MGKVLLFLVVLACPISMIFMMRGMHGGGHAESREAPRDPEVIDTTAQDARVAELEREIARLREAQETHDRELADTRR